MRTGKGYCNIAAMSIVFHSLCDNIIVPSFLSNVISSLSFLIFPSHIPSLSPSLPPSLTHTHTHTHTLSLSHTHTLSLSLTLTLCSFLYQGQISKTHAACRSRVACVAATGAMCNSPVYFFISMKIFLDPGF